MEYHYLLLSMFALENACFRMDVGMMDGYEQGPMVIEHMHLNINSFWVN